MPKAALARPLPTRQTRKKGRLNFLYPSNDPICPWPLTERLADWVAAQGADLTTAYHDGGHEVRREELAALAELLRGPAPAAL